jgi:hypothetical protein
MEKNIRVIDVPEDVKSYLKNLEKQDQDTTQEYDLFNTAVMVQSMRNSAYQNISEAICDIVDNSIEANARRIDIIAEFDDSRKIKSIGILDNGYGMEKRMIEEAIRWGGSHKHDLIREKLGQTIRRQIGRFGSALPTASAFATTHTRIYSKTNETECHCLDFDLTGIVRMDRENKRYIPNAIPTNLPSYIEEYRKLYYKPEDYTTSYTLVLWMEPDKVWGFTREQVFNEKILRKLGYAFKKFISKKFGVNIYVNGNRVDMIDPLFITPEARGYDMNNGIFAETVPGFEIEVENDMARDSFGNPIVRRGKLRVRMSYLPFGENDDPSFQRTAGGKLIKQRWEVMKENESYFIICREGRQICNLGTSPKDLHYKNNDLNITLQNFDMQWNIELDFDAELDELFNVTYLKNQVVIHDKLWDWFIDKFEPSIPKLIQIWQRRTMAASYARRTKKLEAEFTENGGENRPRPSETIVGDLDKFIPPLVSPGIEEKGKQTLERIARKMVSDNEAGSIEEAIEKAREKLKEKKYAVVFNSKGEQDLFYEHAHIDYQLQLIINKGHRFYKDLYLQVDNRARQALELLLFALVTSEVNAETLEESNPERLLFYQSEKENWSKILDKFLHRLDLQNPIIDRMNAEEIDNEINNN